MRRAPVALSSLTVCTRAQSARSRAIPTTIPEMWNAWCARCHGRDGTGKRRRADGQRRADGLHRLQDRVGRADADWEAAIAHGGPAVGLSSQMPAFGDVLTADRSASSSRHLRGSARSGLADRQPESAAADLHREGVSRERVHPRAGRVARPAPARRSSRSRRSTSAGSASARRSRWCCRSSRSDGDRAEPASATSSSGSSTRSSRARRTISLSAGFDFVFRPAAKSRLAGGIGAVFEPYLATATIVGADYLQAQFKLELPTDNSWQTRETVYNMYVGRDTSSSPNTWTSASSSTARTTSGADAADSQGSDEDRRAGRRIRRARADQQARRTEAVEWVGYLLWEYLEPVFVAALIATRACRSLALASSRGDARAARRHRSSASRRRRRRRRRRFASTIDPRRLRPVAARRIDRRSTRPAARERRRLVPGVKAAGAGRARSPTTSAGSCRASRRCGPTARSR